MSLSNHVALTISVDSVGVARAGFGVPLIISHNATWGPELIRFYTDLDGVDDDFAVTSPEYLAAAAMFSQTPHPAQIAIGKCPTKPTQKYTFTPVAIDDHEYRITVVGEGVTTETVSFTSDATATIAEITAGLETALNLVTGKNFTAVDNTTHLTITATAAGDWFSLELGNPGTEGVIVQDHVDPGIAAELSLIVDQNDSWYALCSLYNSEPYVTAVAAWANARTKIYVFDVSDSEAITTAVGNGDTLDAMATLNYGRVAGCYHPSPAAFFAAGWMGRCLPTDPGSITWKFKTLSGIAATPLSSTHRTNLVARNANYNRTVAGKNITAEGTTADGDFIDVQRGIDWLDDDMSVGIFTALSASEKVPYEDDGVSVVESEVRASLQRAVARKILAKDPKPTVTVPLVADVAAADKTARNLPDVKFSGTLSGAIHKVTITGVVTA